MAATDSIDPYIVTALKLLHSSAPDSAEKLRTMLDSEISKNYDKTKLISNLLTKKQLNDEKNAPGSGFKKHKPKKPEEVKVVRPPTPEMIIDDEESADEKKSENDDEMDYSDFTCVTCRQIDSSANNQLFECIECHLLHHQLCHIPKISNDTNLDSWICSTCKGKKEKESSSKSAKSYESSSSSGSSSSNKKPKISTKSSSSDKSSEKKVEIVKKKIKESSSSSSSSRSRSSKK